MKKILILANHYITIYAYRKELVQELINKGFKVYLSIPKAEENEYFAKLGCEIIETPIDRRGTNPIADLKLLISYVKIINKVKPEVMLTYTIKPNIYGGIAARLSKANVIHTVTGLGSVFIQNMWQKKVAVFLNKLAFKNSSNIFFLNEDNEELYRKLRITSKDQITTTIPGSGVNLEEFLFTPLSDDEESITFTFVGRILKDKGIEEYLEVAEEVTKKYSNIRFEVVGFVDDDKYVSLLAEFEQKGIIKYLGKRNDIFHIMKKSTCIVLPSYGEGRGTVLQEGAAVGRPLITCDTYGCRDNVDEEENGYLCQVGSSASLLNAIEKYINLTNEEKKIMGEKSYQKAIREFDRKIVTEKYMVEIMK